MLRAFLSHSSSDKDVVEPVCNSLEAGSAWIDRAEIDWGARFVEAISEAIEDASDFVLFWSAAASKSEWVRFEVNTAFYRMLAERAIRLRVIRLDQTPLPLHLRPYHHLDVTRGGDAVQQIVDALRRALNQPRRGVRHRFLDRNEEVNRIEVAIDHAEVFAVILRGFQGIGKTALAKEALRRLFEGSDIAEVLGSRGTGLVELVLQLAAHAQTDPPTVGASEAELIDALKLAIERIVLDGRFLLFTNIQHWLDEGARPTPTLRVILETLDALPAVREHPALFTSTRLVSLDPGFTLGTVQIRIGGLPDEHLATLLATWFQITTGKELREEDARAVAKGLFGHPVAAKMAANLVASYGADFLNNYPYQVVKLRRDLASSMLRGARLSPESERLMEALAVVDTPVPPRIVAAGIGLTEDHFELAIDQCAAAGLIDYDQGLSAHPLLKDHFWRTHLHRENYRDRAAGMADALWTYTRALDVGSVQFSRFMPACFRLFALSGQLAKAQELRSDLVGQLSEAAIVLYNRRDYGLAKEYVLHVLDADPADWKMRSYLARILIREENWAQADKLLESMRAERPSDVGLRHILGWRLLRADRYEEALTEFITIIAEREHVASLRDAAECLHQLGKDDDALSFLGRAKRVDLENPYVLDLEARILEAQGEYSRAYDAALLAALRDPKDWAFEHRLGHIRIAQGRTQDAIAHFRQSAALNGTAFSPASSLLSALLDTGQLVEAEAVLDGTLSRLATNQTERAVVEHMRARLLWKRGRASEAAALLEPEIRRGGNLVANLGLYAQILIALFDQQRHTQPASAALHLTRASDAVHRGLSLEPANSYLLDAKRELDQRRSN